MNDKQLHYFKIIAHTGSLNRAAATAFVSVQALKKQMDALEKELNTQLFVRSSTGSRLTAAGETLLSGITAIEPQIKRVLAAVKDAAAVEEITVCFPNNMFVEEIEHLTSAFEQGHPQVRFKYVALRPADWLRAIADGEADVCVYVQVPEIEQLGLSCQPISVVNEHQLMVVMAQQDPLTAESIVSLTDLNQRRVGLDDLDVYADLIAALADGQVTADLTTFPVDKLKMMDFCKRGGVYVMTRIEAQQLAPLQCRPLDFKPQPRFWVYRRDASRAVQAFIQSAL